MNVPRNQTKLQSIFVKFEQYHRVTIVSLEVDCVPYGRLIIPQRLAQLFNKASIFKIVSKHSIKSNPVSVKSNVRRVINRRKKRLYWFLQCFPYFQTKNEKFLLAIVANPESNVRKNCLVDDAMMAQESIAANNDLTPTIRGKLTVTVGFLIADTIP